MAYRGLSLYLNGFIASVYTELNAVSKGTSLGIFTKDDDRGVEAAKDGSQPYIELMGRRYALTVHLLLKILKFTLIY